MADLAHVEILKQGVDQWNSWRAEHPDVQPNLSGVNLMPPGFKKKVRRGGPGSLAGINFANTMLAHSLLEAADLDGADLTRAHLDGTYLKRASLRNAILDGAFMQDVNLRSASLVGASLKGVDLRRAIMVETDVSGADLTDCNVFGVAAWNVRTTDATNQSRLIVQDYNAPAFVVPGLGLAHFVYMLTQPTGLREVLQVMISNGVLLLGRFTTERKTVLDAVGERLTRLGYVPLMFDFEPIAERNLVETVVVLAGLSRFVLVDLSDAKAVNFEVPAIARALALPILLAATATTTDADLSEMWNALVENEWVSNTIVRYDTVEHLLQQLPGIIEHADAMRAELQTVRRERKLIVHSK